MTEKILAVLFVFIKSVVAATGYGGVAILMAIESRAFLCVRMDHAFCGYLVYEGSMKLLWVATAGAIAATSDPWWPMRLVLRRAAAGGEIWPLDPDGPPRVGLGRPLLSALGLLAVLIGACCL